MTPRRSPSGWSFPPQRQRRDYTRVLLDGQELLYVPENSTIFGVGWTLVTVSIAPSPTRRPSARFDSVNHGQRHHNFMIDDVAIETCGGVKQVFAELFHRRPALGDKNWKWPPGVHGQPHRTTFSARGTVDRSLSRSPRPRRSSSGSPRDGSRQDEAHERPSSPRQRALVFARKSNTAYATCRSRPASS